MRTIRYLLVLLALFSTQSILAADEGMMSSDTKPCGMIAKACVDAGFTRDNSADKRFWQDCMKPIVLGKTVQGINIDAATAKQCRTDKVQELKSELNEMETMN